MPSILIDTNILVYMFEPREEERQEKAISILQRLNESDEGCLSVQCLSEFFRVMTAKKRLPINQAMDQLERWNSLFPVFNLTPQIVLEAARGVRDHGLAYYDSQIWAAARLNQIPIVFSEDFQDGQTLEGIRFANPFAKEFDIEAWL